MLKAGGHFIWADLPKVIQFKVPICEQAFGEAGLCLFVMLADEVAANIFPMTALDALPHD